MAYTFKLSRRLAQAHLGVLVLLIGCAESQAPEVAIDSGLPPQMDRSCPHAPPDFTPVSTQPFTAVPPSDPSADAFGWSVHFGSSRLSSIVDPMSPSRGHVMEARFAQGDPGGKGPFRLDLPFRRTYRSVYMCLSTRLSSNFTANGNAMVKFAFIPTAYQHGSQRTNHFLSLYPRLGINLQSTHGILNRNLWSTLETARELGRWRRIEALLVGNSEGQADGVARLWVDGELVLDATDVRYFFPGQQPRFTAVSWNPTYGGGLNPVPFDIYQWVDDWYVSVQ